MSMSNVYFKLKNEKGAALLSALIIVTIVTITGVAIGQLTSHTQKDTVADYDSTYAFYNTDDALVTSEYILDRERHQSDPKSNNILTDGENLDAMVVATRKESKWWLDNTQWIEGKPQYIVDNLEVAAKGQPVFHIEDLNGGSIHGIDKHGTINDEAQTIINFYRITARSFGYIASENQSDNSESIMQTIYVQTE